MFKRLTTEVGGPRGWRASLAPAVLTLALLSLAAYGSSPVTGPDSGPLTPQAPAQAASSTSQPTTFVAPATPRSPTIAAPDKAPGPSPTATPEATPTLTPAPGPVQEPVATPRAVATVATLAPEPTPSPVPTATPPAVTPPPQLQDVDALIRATQDPDWKTRWDAVNALGELKDLRGVPALVGRALRDKNPHPRWRSLWALSAVDREGAEAIPLLLEGLKDAEPVTVRNAAVALAFFGHPASRPELLNGLEDADPWRRWEAVFSLKRVGGPEVAAALIRLLDESVEPNERVRQESTLTLGRMGGPPAVPDLVRTLLWDSSPQVRWRAALALRRVGEFSAVAALQLAQKKEKDPQVLDHIRKALAQLSGG